EFIVYEDVYVIAVHEMRGMRRTGRIFVGVIRDGFYEAEDISDALAGVALRILGRKNPAVVRVDMLDIRRGGVRREELEGMLLAKCDLLCVNHQELMTREEVDILIRCGSNVVYTSTRSVDNSIKLNIYRCSPEKALEALARRDLVRFVANDLRPLSDRGTIPFGNAETFLRRHGTEVPCSYEIMKAVERHRTLDNVCYPGPGSYLSGWRSVLRKHVDREGLKAYIGFLLENGRGSVSERFLKVLCRAGDLFTLSSIRTLLERVEGRETDTLASVKDLIDWGLLYRHPSDEDDAVQRYSMSDYVRCILKDFESEGADERGEIANMIADCVEAFCGTPEGLKEAYEDTHVLSGLLVSHMEVVTEKEFSSERPVMKRMFELIDGGFFTFMNTDTGDAIKSIHDTMRRSDVARIRRTGELKLGRGELEARMKIISRYVTELVNGNDPSERTIVPMILGKVYALLADRYGSDFSGLADGDLDMLYDFARCQSEITVYTMDHLVADDSDVRFFRRMTELLLARHGLEDEEELLRRLELGSVDERHDQDVCRGRPREKVEEFLARRMEEERRSIRRMLGTRIFPCTAGQSPHVVKHEAPVRYHMLAFLVRLFGLEGGVEPVIGRMSQEGLVGYRDIRDLAVLFEWLRQKGGTMDYDGRWADHPLNLLYLRMEDRFSPRGENGRRRILCRKNARTQDYARFRIAMYGAYNIMKNHGYTHEDRTLEALDVGWILDTVNSREEKDVIRGEVSIQNAYQFVDNQTLYNVEHALKGALDSRDYQCRALAYDCLSVSYTILGRIPEATESYLTAANYYNLAGKTALMMLMRARAAETALSAGDVSLAVASRDRLKEYVMRNESDAPLMCRMIRECLKKCY
ncbi:MAG: hypothetical protein MJZ38_04710, partial [archaeon]|nr:hypothetical protein [archaeon]